LIYLFLLKPYKGNISETRLGHTVSPEALRTRKLAAKGEERWPA